MKTVQVTIYIKHGKGGPEGTVVPYSVELSLKDKDDVKWELKSEYRDASADIENKSSGDDWPFDTTPPKKIKEGNPKKSGKIKHDAKRDNSYSVKCTFTDGTQPIEIDPDIIIIGGSLIPDP